MNRKKKIKAILKKRAKASHAKAHPSLKPKYIAKADREKAEADAKQASDGGKDTNEES